MVTRINGKYLDTMKERNCEEKHDLKKIYYRKLDTGDYLLYAYKSELLMVNGRLAENIITKKNVDINDDETYEILSSNKFLCDDNYNNHELPLELSNYKVNIMNFIYVLVFVTSVFYNAYKIDYDMTYNLLKNISFRNHLLLTMVIGIIFSITTTVNHEFMHAVFSNNLQGIKESINLSIKNSVASVSLTHVWLWSKFSRLLAVAAGVMLDSITLSLLIILRHFISNSITTVMFIILFLRIIWQFRFHRNTDGKLFIMMLLDNPFLYYDYKNNKESLNTKELIICRITLIIGWLIDLYLLFLWVIPISFKLVNFLGARL